MALVVFLRGVNVGGNKTFRPSLLVKELNRYDVVNIGAAGTFVVRKPVSKTKFHAELLKKLPFETEIIFCQGRDLLRLEKENPFEGANLKPEITRFVSVSSKMKRTPLSIPFSLPEKGRWLVKIIGAKKQFVFGMYRRDMKTIRYLGQIDKIFGAQASTRNWNTIATIIEILKT